MIETLVVEKKSFYAFVGLPEAVTVVLFIISVILLLSPYLAGIDFGIFKIPIFDEKINKRLKIIGPVLILFIITGFLPVQVFIIAKSIPPYIKNYDPTKFDIVDENIRIDLSLREKINQEVAKRDRVSPAKWTIKTRLKKTGDAPAFLYKDIWTSGLKPDVSCSTHQISLMEIPYEPNAGRVKLIRYALLIDVSKNPPNQEFEIQCTYIYWNGFQNETEDWSVAVIKHPTKKLTFTILSPRDKPFKSYSLYSYLTNDAPGLEIFTEPQDFEFNEQKMIWQVDHPETNKSYRIVWLW